MCNDTLCELTFETLLTDPLTHMVMRADGVTIRELVDVMDAARDAMVARERLAVRRAVSLHHAKYEPV